MTESMNSMKTHPVQESSATQMALRDIKDLVERMTYQSIEEMYVKIQPILTPGETEPSLDVKSVPTIADTPLAESLCEIRSMLERLVERHNFLMSRISL